MELFVFFLRDINMKELAFVLSLQAFIKDVTPTHTQLLHPSP